MKKMILCASLVLFLSALSLFLYGYTQSEKISSSVIRLHIIANSDTAFDQETKLKVRDKIIETMSEKFKEADDIEDAEEIIKNNLNEITNAANSILTENNCSYTACSTFGTYDFPLKSYSNITLPKGKYNAVRISLGKGGGENWWCVMFPPLCFTDDTTGVLNDKSKEILVNSLGNSTYEIIDNTNTELNIRYKFKLIELFDDIKSYF